MRSRLDRPKNQKSLACRSGRRAHRASRLETLAAINRATLGWFKWDRGFPPALRAGRHGLRLGETASATTLAFGLTRFTALGFVFEVFVVEEVLFSRCKYKFCRTVYTLENSVLKLRHNLCPVAYQYWWLRRRDRCHSGSRRQFTRSPGDSSSGYVCEPAPAWP